jgi:hypothetical protein
MDASYQQRISALRAEAAELPVSRAARPAQPFDPLNLK